MADRHLTLRIVLASQANGKLGDPLLAADRENRPQTQAPFRYPWAFGVGSAERSKSACGPPGVRVIDQRHPSNQSTVEAGPRFRRITGSFKS